MKKLQQRSVAELIDGYLTNGIGLEDILDLFRNSVIMHALGMNHGNVSQTAKMLKVHRNSVQRLMTKYHVQKEAFYDSDLESAEKRNENGLEPEAMAKTETLANRR